MMIFVETNVLIASAQEFHPWHLPALNLVASVESGSACTSVHCLAEFYSVTTRLPKSVALRAREAEQFVESFSKRFTLVQLDAIETLNELLMCGARGITGGRAYDALILAAARKAGSTLIYTLNARHFRQIAPELTDIIREP